MNETDRDPTPGAMPYASAEAPDAGSGLLFAAECAAGTLEGVRRLLGHLTDAPPGACMPVEALQPIESVLHEIQQSLDAAVEAIYGARQGGAAA